MPQNQYIFDVRSRGLNEARKLQIDKAKVATDFIPRYRELLPVQEFINNDELHRWTMKAQKEISIIEGCIAEKIDFTTSYRESAKGIMRDSKLAFERGQMSEKTLVELNLFKDEAIRVKEQETKEILPSLIQISGKDLVRSIFESLTDVESSGLRQHLGIFQTRLIRKLSKGV
ncbi:hypothetical protein OCU04_011091 [Sclerotinia nivalis]|uniref:Uncharacterized protein n=1 Tax=Sclerotinia nivalis TaxID=352851 RepID=A0A9X0ADJ3_9HELO|nr:hypothetical protein OCU04_011091 [Sclerotinia nivalis]